MSGGQQRFRNKSTFRMKMQSQKQRNKTNNNNETNKQKTKLVKIMKENLKKTKFKAKCKISIFKHALEEHLTWPHLNLGDMNQVGEPGSGRALRGWSGLYRFLGRSTSQWNTKQTPKRKLEPSQSTVCGLLI